MDISFHYFAVKSVAQAAGFDENKAQRIATFSQFIDDYNWYVYFRANNIPDYVKAPELDIVYNNLLSVVNPVTTGFSDMFDYATLILPRSQRFTVSPFHFIPQDKHSRDIGDNRVVPATLNNESYISNMLNKVKANYISQTLPESDALMQIGGLFHVFADTYAHQLFTGFNNVSNSVQLLSVTDNISGADVTQQYKYYIEKWIAKVESIIKTKMPAIGHMVIGHVPDLTHLSFSMKHKDLQGKELIHTRSNTETFVRTCSEMYQYLRSCLEPLGINPHMSWDELAPKLAEGFLLDASKELDQGEKQAVQKLSPHWSSIFSGYSYSYDSEMIKKQFMGSTTDDRQIVQVDGNEVELYASSYSDDFYKFSVFADRLLISLYGAHPRNWLSEDQDIPYKNVKTEETA